MAYFDKFANLSTAGWAKATATQAMRVGDHAHIGLSGGEKLAVRAQDPTVCSVHEEPLPKHHSGWRHFLLTPLREGLTDIHATLAGTVTPAARMTVRVSGSTGVRLVFFPGERDAGEGETKRVEGTIYVIGGKGEKIMAAGGPRIGRADKGGHTAEPTPPGIYTLGPKVHVTTNSWPTSVIAWGAPLRINAHGEAEYDNGHGHWVEATGRKGTVTRAVIAFHRRSNETLADAYVVEHVRRVFIDPATGRLRAETWLHNDFGRWGWNLLRRGAKTAYWVHTTPNDEESAASGKSALLLNSHGCVHIDPREREAMMKAGYLKEGIVFEVRPYSESGPP